MVQIEELQLEWAKYRYRMKKFEHEKEADLIKRFPLLSSSEIDKKVNNSIERKFATESQRLLQVHLSVTNPFRKV